MTKVQDHYDRILRAVDDALKAGVRVHIGGDPAVIQVTQGKESYCLRTAYVQDKTGSDLKAIPLVEKPQVMSVQHPVGCQYTGELCVKCGSGMMVRTGTCSTCMNCGDTSSCG